MIDHVSHPKLPKGLSYVLKTSLLAEALADAGVCCAVNLVYWSPQAVGSILEGHYWLPNENVPHPRVYVRAGAVPSALRPTAVKLLSAEALPEFVRWLRAVLALPDGSPALIARPYFNAVITAGGLTITDRPVYKARR